MPTEHDVNDKWVEARLAILDKLIESTSAPSNVLKLAEAFAWLTRPDNAHGGSSTNA